MNKYNKGSLWRRWDLHIHTPGTKKNDQFSGNTIDEKWQKYIENINNSKEEIAVIGVTDYFSIDNYFTFLEKVKNGEITKNFDLIVPNVELRMSPITGSGKAINIHCLFNPSIAEEVESRFLSELKFPHGKTEYRATKHDLIRLGENLIRKTETQTKEEAFNRGIGEYIVSLDNIKQIFEKDKELRENTIIVVANNQDGVSGVRKHSDFFDKKTNTSILDAKVESIYQFVDAIFSSNEGDRDYFSGHKTTEEDVIKKHHSLMPCYHGCDAHENDKIFKPDLNRYCWIKADPTFNGLKQTLYEPRERTIVQEEMPNDKLGYQVIDRIEIGYSDIGNDIIELNPGLNCIIGGRSTGKSILLASIAQKLKDAAKAKEHNEKYNIFVKDISKSLKLIWKDGIEDDEREIEFFNQGYMNEYSREENIKKFDDLVRDILKEKNNGNLFEEYDDFVEKNKTEIQAEINHLYNFLHKISEREQEIKDIGDIEGIDLEIKSLEEKIAGIKKSNQFSEQDYEDFQSKKELLTTTKTEREHLSSDKDNIPKITRELSITPLPSYWNELSEEYKKVVEEIYEKAKTAFFKTWNEEITLVNSKIDTAISDLKAKEEAIQNEESYKKGIKILESNNVLNTLEKRLTSEKEKKRNIEELKAEITRLQKDVETAKQKIIDKHKLFYSEAKRIADSLTTELEDNSLKILAYPRFLEKEYRDLLHYAINLQGTERKNQADYRYSDNENYVKEFTEKFEELLKDKIVLKNGFNGRKLIERILPESNYTVSYEVHYEGDKYSEMSEGKQAFVVLKLLLDFSDRKCPIFIDQPEDDLDNRAIFNDLVTYLRKKKKERQIIVVTHNPNIVVGTDAELVLVANQHGVKNKNNGNKKFNYAVGSIEHSIPLDKDNPIVLERQGIREHICEILEGGETAFKKREKRYDIKS